jgi:hypothetical protein
MTDTPPLDSKDPGAPEKKKPLMTIVSIVVMVASYVAVQFLPTLVAIRLGAGMLAGLLIGLIPFFIFRNRDKKWASNALLVCMVSGLICGVVLAIPAAIIISIIASNRIKRAEADQPPDLPSVGGK